MAFVRAFIIPPKSGKYCFGDGNPCMFTEVDGFRDEPNVITGKSATAEEMIAFIKTKKIL